MSCPVFLYVQLILGHNHLTTVLRFSYCVSSLFCLLLSRHFCLLILCGMNESVVRVHFIRIAEHNFCLTSNVDVTINCDTFQRGHDAVSRNKSRKRNAVQLSQSWMADVPCLQFHHQNKSQIQNREKQGYSFPFTICKRLVWYLQWPYSLFF